MDEPVVKYISLKHLYQMNPPRFILNMLKQIEKRNVVELRKNAAGEYYVAYGISTYEDDMIERFKHGNLDPRKYSTKNETFDREFEKLLEAEIKIAKKYIEDIPLTQLDKSNSGVVKHFFDNRLSKRIKETGWGTKNLKIVPLKNGWGLINYKTLLAFRSYSNDIYINSQKYSRSTTAIQTNIVYWAKEANLGGLIATVSESELYRISEIRNETRDYPYMYTGGTYKPLTLEEGLNLTKKPAGPELTIGAIVRVFKGGSIGDHSVWISQYGIDFEIIRLDKRDPNLWLPWSWRIVCYDLDGKLYKSMDFRTGNYKEFMKTVDNFVTKKVNDVFDKDKKKREGINEGLKLVKKDVHQLTEDDVWEFRHILSYFRRIANHFSEYQVDFQDSNVYKDNIDMLISTGNLDFSIQWSDSDRFGGEINLRISEYNPETEDSDVIESFDINKNTEELPDYDPVPRIIEIIEEEIRNNTDSYQGEPFN